MTYLNHAFNEVCDGATQASRHCVSLYERVPFYGGPEEGGWWGSDDHLVAYREYPSETEAEAAAEAVRKLAADLDAKARDDHGRLCQDQLDFCEARGIDDSNAIFGEVDGPTTYWVTVETKPGSHESRGCRHYE